MDVFTSDHYKNLNARERYAALIAQKEVNHLTKGENFIVGSSNEAREKEVELGYLQTDLDGDQIFEKIISTAYSPEAFSYYTNIYAPDGEKIIVDGSLWETFVDDLTGDGIKELIVITTPGHVSATYIFSYENNHLIRIPVYDEEGAELQRTMYDQNGAEFQVSWLMTREGISFEDLDGDGVKEIIMPVKNYSNEFVELTYYYRWNGQGFILYKFERVFWRNLRDATNDSAG
ncbi:MAG: hypothetical protein A3J46_02770 [Candidatus Yanofskybacteria bacterium RIFCSPHIGHO2_02_FULL_41_11]|uniref:Uncharacterized protein n=1 Tax=Candidatus Yanofskybacteria bacterium RIFCSPHIGHO2_02_FULL_41_11 TaxID=1802675 RepID=A0A1F8F9B7_9BACT|nr:MAG: hypothetical protein A3J46_02770 [Candidatus Yanofskybacteria bacterium RIFCSPHIGHO2_02_FULL_41_11]